MYIKDDISKYYTANTPVTFHEEKVTLTGKTEEGKEIRFQCDIATNVRIREAMKEHPVIEKLNNCAVKALDRYLGVEDCWRRLTICKPTKTVNNNKSPIQSKELDWAFFVNKGSVLPRVT